MTPFSASCTHVAHIHTDAYVHINKNSVNELFFIFHAVGLHQFRVLTTCSPPSCSAVQQLMLGTPFAHLCSLLGSFSCRFPQGLGTSAVGETPTSAAGNATFTHCLCLCHISILWPEWRWTRRKVRDPRGHLREDRDGYIWLLLFLARWRGEQMGFHLFLSKRPWRSRNGCRAGMLTPRECQSLH